MGTVSQVTLSEIHTQRSGMLPTLSSGERLMLTGVCAEADLSLGSVFWLL